MPKLFNIAISGQRLDVAGGREARPMFIQGRAPEIQPPTASPRIAPQPMQMPSNVRMPNTIDPWEVIGKGLISFYEGYSQAATKLQDEKDRVAASEAARLYDEDLRTIVRGDADNEIGYLYLDEYSAVKKKGEYDSRVDAAMKARAGALDPNARRYAMEKMLGYRKVALNEISSHHLASHRATQKAEKAAQYQGFMRRLDDFGADVGSAMAEIGAYVMTLPEAEQEKSLSGIFKDYTSLISSKDPELALPLMEEFREKASPAFDVDSATHYGNQFRAVAKQYNQALEQRNADYKEALALERENNYHQMFKDLSSPEGPDIERYRRLAEAGRIDIGHFNTLKNQWEERAFLPRLTADQEYAIKNDYLENRITEEDIMSLNIRQSDKDRIYKVITDFEASDKRESFKHYYQYVGDMVEAKAISSLFSKDQKVIAANAQEAFRELVKKSPDKTLFSVANEVLSTYGVEFTEYDKLPSIVVPGEGVFRPTTWEERVEAIKALKRADELNLLTEAQVKSKKEILNSYERFIDQMEKDAKAAQEAKEAEKKRRERPLTEKLKGLLE